MTLLTADHIFDGYSFLPEHSVIQISDDGIIQQIMQEAPADQVKKYKGLLMPGMVNVHCHLELSFMKNQIDEKKGLVDFLLNVLAIRGKFSMEEKLKAIQEAEDEMIRNGIVAVGDISNTADTVLQKSMGNLNYQTFVECLGLSDDKASVVYNHAKEIHLQFLNVCNSSLVLHAPYTISNNLIKLVDNDSVGKVTTIHNQETAAENELFLTGTGDFLKLFDAVGFDKSEFVIEHKNSIRTYFPKFLNQKKIILVHNTFSSEADIQWAHALNKELYWCLCPNANLYIENTLPDIDMMMKNKCRIVLGTDSLASNHQLSIWEEITTIKNLKPQIPFEEMLKWATSNGAKALGMHEIGSFETGKQPGIINIPDFTFESTYTEQQFSIARII